MNTVPTYHTDTLRNLYRDNEGLYAPFFDWAAGRSNDASETTVDTIKRKTRLDHADAIALMRALGDAGIGDFKVGRRGQKTRLAWHFSLRSVGAAALGDEVALLRLDTDRHEEEEVEDDDEDEEDEEDSAKTRHGFLLRRDMRVHFDLPKDLTAAEAERLAAFIRTLPFA
jgi:hypothetical protein